MRPVFTWSLGSRSLELGKSTLIMGIVNVTPDSFSDGGQHFSSEAALAHALRLHDEGAQIIDIGGESTRPGAKAGTDDPAVSSAEELRRVLPVISGVRKARPEAVVSIDTYKSAVARAAAEAGAEIVNDVSGLQWDPQMAAALAKLTCGIVMMHSRGRPDEWTSLPALADVVTSVKRELRERADKAVLSGIRRDRIAVDPGFGFGKRNEENFPMLRRFAEFHDLHFPLVVGVSRKSFIARAVAGGGTSPEAGERLFGTIGAEVTLALRGAHIIRTHDVKACRDALRLADIAA
jgi:dihydropteroate synthase